MTLSSNQALWNRESLSDAENAFADKIAAVVSDRIYTVDNTSVRLAIRAVHPVRDAVDDRAVLTQLVLLIHLVPRSQDNSAATQSLSSARLTYAFDVDAAVDDQLVDFDDFVDHDLADLLSDKPARPEYRRREKVSEEDQGTTASWMRWATPTALGLAVILGGTLVASAPGISHQVREVFNFGTATLVVLLGIPAGFALSRWSAMPSKSYRRPTKTTLSRSRGQRKRRAARRRK